MRNSVPLHFNALVDEKILEDFYFHVVVKVSKQKFHIFFQKTKNIYIYFLQWMTLWHGVKRLQDHKKSLVAQTGLALPH